MVSCEFVLILTLRFLKFFLGKFFKEVFESVGFYLCVNHPDLRLYRREV